jgi:hypothetical protein
MCFHVLSFSKSDFKNYKSDKHYIVKNLLDRMLESANRVCEPSDKFVQQDHTKMQLQYFITKDYHGKPISGHHIVVTTLAPAKNNGMKPSLFEALKKEFELHFKKDQAIIDFNWSNNWTGK